MAGEREELNDLTGTDPAGTSKTDDAANLGQDGENGNNADTGTTGGDGKGKVEVDPFADREAFLDTLRQVPKGDQPQGKQEIDAQGNAAPKTGDKPAGTSAADPKGAAQPVVKTDIAKTPEQEADDLIKEMGVKSERGQNRIREVFTKSKEMEAKAQTLETDINEFRTMVQSTGLDPEEFLGMLEVGKLMKSGTAADKRLAFDRISAQRESLARELGIEAPGVDALSDFPDLQKKVDNLEITKETALELAKYKRQERTQQQQQQAQQQSQQDMDAFTQSIQKASDTATQYFMTRKHEADYEPKMKMIHAKFKDPAYMQEFVTTYEPKQWFGLFKMMYDNMVVPAQQRANNDQPARSRAANLGSPAATGDDNQSHMKSIIQQMGIGT